MIATISKKFDQQLFEQMLKTLKPSSSVVMFSPYKEFLVDYFAMFMDDPRFVDVHMAEPWMREYQTAPGRCHPLMSMSGHGGYLLSTIYVLE
jgi:tRNA (adenine-N(1)-)-methyltransferase non-catalytic subunit